MLPVTEPTEDVAVSGPLACASASASAFICVDYSFCLGFVSVEPVLFAWLIHVRRLFIFRLQGDLGAAESTDRPVGMTFYDSKACQKFTFIARELH